MAGKRGSGEGTVTYNDERKRWEGRITVGFDRDGKQVRKKMTGSTRTQVVQRLRQAKDAHETGQQPARRDLSVGRFLDDWLADVLPGTVAASTAQQYGEVVKNYVKPHLGSKRLTALTARDVSRMLAELEQRGLSANTRRLARSILRRALRTAEAEGMVPRNVAAIADGVKVATEEGRTLSPEQARALLLHVSGHRLEAGITVALGLGLRLGELLGLAWDDLDLDATPPRLTIRRSVKRISGRGLVFDEPKTRQSRRTVHLPASVVSALKAHRVRQLEERLAAGDLWEPLPHGRDLVFRTPDGTALDSANFRHAMSRLTTAAGLGHWTPHELRHSAASLLLAQGVPLKVVSETLGHSSIRVTADIYAHLMEPAKSEAAIAMETALWGTK